MFQFLLVRLQTCNPSSALFRSSTYVSIPFSQALDRLSQTVRSRLFMFQFLLVRLQTDYHKRYGVDYLCFNSFQLGFRLFSIVLFNRIASSFQFLLVRLQTMSDSTAVGNCIQFQFLLVRLQTYTNLVGKYHWKACFNSFQLGFRPFQPNQLASLEDSFNSFQLGFRPVLHYLLHIYVRSFNSFQLGFRRIHVVLVATTLPQFQFLLVRLQTGVL